MLVSLVLLGCHLAEAENPTEDASDTPFIEVGHEGDAVRGVRIGGKQGVLAGKDEQSAGIRVGGEKGVVIGTTPDAAGVRVGGEKGVLIGKDAKTRGIRVGGEKGIVIDSDKGITIGGKKLIGRARKAESSE